VQGKVRNYTKAGLLRIPVLYNQIK